MIVAWFIFAELVIPQSNSTLQICETSPLLEISLHSSLTVGLPMCCRQCILLWQQGTQRGRNEALLRLPCKALLSRQTHVCSTRAYAETDSDPTCASLLRLLNRLAQAASETMLSVFFFGPRTIPGISTWSQSYRLPFYGQPVERRSMYTDATGVPIRGSFSGSYEGCITVGSMWLKINNATKLRQLRPRLKNSASNNLQSYHPQIIAPFAYIVSYSFKTF